MLITNLVFLKKMKKILYLFIFVPLVFSSCSKEDDDNTPNAVQGCTDPAATNYNQNATQDDGSCTYIITCLLYTSPSPRD